MTSCRVDFESLGVRVECADGVLLNEVAHKAGIGLVSTCSGLGLCGRCRVQVVDGAVSPLTEAEREWLSATELADGYRLACQTHVLGDIKVYVPASSLLVAQRLQLVGEEIEVAFEPVVEECLVALSPASMDDPRPDWARLVESLESTYKRRVTTADLMALRRLSPILREGGWQARVSVRGEEIVDVRPLDRGPLGLAVDLGTTKIAAHLVDMETGDTLAAEGIMNPQIAYGEDVISRISYTMESGGGKLRQVVIEGLNELIKKLCPEPERIVEATLVGNTAMHHLFLGLPVRQLGLAPYLPAVKASLDVKARDLGLCIAPGAYVHLLPNVAGFIGADHVAMILATGIYKTDKTVVGLDIGTNTEVVLTHGGEMRTTSCASGPAFEARHIKHGMLAASGAVEKVKILDSAVEFQTVNGAPPIGLCGSGIVDALAELHRIGLINRRGRLGDGPGIRQVGNTREFVLVSGEGSKTGQDITITQKDISEIQLAKAAIRTGIEALLDEAEIAWEQVEKVILAGAFGTYIDPASAIGIGMFPALPLERFKQVGNAAGMGAKLALISKLQRTNAGEIARRVRYLELMTHPNFPMQFAHAMYFPAE